MLPWPEAPVKEGRVGSIMNPNTPNAQAVIDDENIFYPVNGNS